MVPYLFELAVNEISPFPSGLKIAIASPRYVSVLISLYPIGLYEQALANPSKVAFLIFDI